MIDGCHRNCKRNVTVCACAGVQFLGFAFLLMFKETRSKISCITVVTVLLAFWVCIVRPKTAFAQAANPQQEEAFRLAVQAYTENRFSDARTMFESVHGAHAEEAQKYLLNIKAYRDAIEEANGVLGRSADELDVRSLEFAISKYEQAIAIKKDGPWQAQQQLEKARALKAKLESLDGQSLAARDRKFCEKALQAAKAHSYKEAQLFSCPLANDNPAFSCGGDEAVHMCQEMTELAKLNPRPAGNAASASTPSDGFREGMAAYEKNDFEVARARFATVSGSEKAQADEYLRRLQDYTASMEKARNLAAESNFDGAQESYQQAAAIKPDGPGNPQQQAFLIDLRRGIERFYAGDYTRADESLEKYAHESTEKQDLVSFYRGACKLGRFFLEGATDNNLREQALIDLRTAKKSGFVPRGQNVSPKILQAYEEVSF